jgi:amino acid adenylation domain-containing protein
VDRSDTMTHSVSGAAFPPIAWEDGESIPAGMGDRPLLEAWARAANIAPDKLALVESANAYRCTHKELAALTNRWGARLTAEGVAPGEPVGLCTGAEIETAVGFLAILEAQAAVVPLDPSLPSARLRAMVDGVGCRVVLVSDRTAEKLEGGLLLNLSGDPGDHSAAAVAHDPERLALIYHTSGSTGRPKPVALSHRALTSRILSMIEWLGLGADEVVCAGSSLAFDPFLQQLFFPLVTGGTLWFPERVALLDPLRFWAEAAAQGVTHLNLVPSQIEPLLARPPAAGLRSLRRVLIGGERMPSDLPARAAAAIGPAAIYNMYGPTEATVDATGYRAEPGAADGEIPIGRPLPGCRVRILDEELRRVPIGEAGELCIGGAGLAVGYLGMEQATAAAFIPDPFGAPGDRLYRTGDLCRWLPDGNIAFIGRRDDQVKIRCQRIELGEVEAAMRAFEGVTTAAAVKWDDAPGGAAVIGHFAGEADPAALRVWLAAHLPAAAVPVHLLWLPALPTLPSGKVDRNALPRPTVAPARRHSATSLEQSIAGVWADLLGLSKIDVAANLFEMGAHSLLVPRAAIAIEEATGKPVSAVDLFRFPTVAALARHLSGDTLGNDRPTPRRSAGSGEIAIVGMAFSFPGAADCEAFWADLMAGVDRVRRPGRGELEAAGAPARLIDHPDFVAAHAAIEGIGFFDPLPFGYSQGEAAEIDPQQRLLLELAWHALEDAACDPAADGPVGVFAGVGFNAYFVDNLRGRIGLAGEPDRFAAVVASDKDFAATRIAYKLGLTGPALTVNSACSTALSATAMAVDSLRAGRCRVALAGAASLGMFSGHGHIWAEGGIASRAGVCRPFDAEADGIVSGAGAAVLALKRVEDAMADGDRIYATIRGVGITNDGARKAAYSAPSVDGQAAAIRAALADAGVSPAEIGFVEGHGTGTLLGDPIEVAALNAAYAGVEHGQVLLGSVKGNVGHLDAAAGMAGLVKATLAVAHGMVPPTAHFSTANPRIPFAEGPFRVNKTPEPWPGPQHRLRLAGVSAFGMGGTNIHVIVGAAPNSETVAMPDQPVLLTVSAASTAARQQLAGTVAEQLETPLAEAASSLARRRPMRFRRAVAAASAADAAAALRGVGASDGEAGGETLSIALMFPGQGAQQAGMAGALYHAVPAVRAVIDEAALALRGGPLENLTELLLTRDGDAAATAALSETERTQPALFLTEYAIAKALEAFGIRPAALIGHSIGEYAAACLAGVMSFEDALRLVIARGRLMAAAPRGAMLAASLPETEFAPLVARCGADLAAVNGARQCVASGTTEQIEALAAMVAASRKPAHRLPVSHAFHSELMTPILDAFGEEAAKVRLQPPAMPVVSNLSGDWLKPEQATDPAYWVRHLRSTVRFADGLRCLLAEPTHLLVEAGPGATLARLARGAGVPETRAIATQSPDISNGHLAFLAALGRLWVAGAPVDRLASAGNAPRRARVPGYPFERTRLWIEPGTSAVTHAAIEPVVAAAPVGPDGAAAAIADVWREVLGVPAIGPDDDFLALGGDSLIAIRIAARLRHRLGRELGPSALFQGGTVAGLARLVAETAPLIAAVAGDAREEGWL